MVDDSTPPAEPAAPEPTELEPSELEPSGGTDAARPALWRRVRDARAVAVANERARVAARRAREVTVAVAKDERTAEVLKAGLAVGVAALVAHRRGDQTPWTTAFAERTGGAGSPTPTPTSTPPSARSVPAPDGPRPWHELYAAPPPAGPRVEPPPTTPPAPATPLSVFSPPTPPPAPAPPAATGPSASRVADALRQAHQDQMAVIRNLRA